MKKDNKELTREELKDKELKDMAKAYNVAEDKMREAFKDTSIEWQTVPTEEEIEKRIADLKKEMNKGSYKDKKERYGSLMERLDELREKVPQAKTMTQDELIELWYNKFIEQEKRINKEREELREKEKALKEREAKLEAEKLKLEETKQRVFISGHLIDQTLKRGGATALDLFDVLNSRDVENIKDTNVELSSVIEGAKLTPLQNEIMLTLAKLRGESFKSIVPIEAINNKWDKLELTTAFGGGIEEEDKEEIPIIIITPYEFTKELKGANPSGTTQENAEKALIQLSRNKYLMREIKRYERIGKGGKKHWLQKESVGYKSLLTVEESTITAGVDDTVEMERRVLKIMLNPIFIRDLERKYISYPNNIVVRTIEANVEAGGSSKVSGVVYLLRDYLARALSNKNKAKEKTTNSIVNTISLKLLFETIEPNQNERRKKKRLNDNFKRALEVCKKIGLLEKYEYRTSSKGEKQIAFFIYKKWE